MSSSSSSSSSSDDEIDDELNHIKQYKLKMNNLIKSLKVYLDICSIDTMIICKIHNTIKSMLDIIAQYLQIITIKNLCIFDKHTRLLNKLLHNDDNFDYIKKILMFY